MSYSVEELFRFLRVEEGYDIQRYLKKDDPSVTELEIPAEYNGRPVVKIRHEAFYGAKYIRRVKTPGSVRILMRDAFANCSSLEEVEFSEGLELISNEAIAGTALKSVILPKSLNAIYWEAFAFCGELERVEFNSAPVIELNAFSGCPKLPPETVVMGIVRSFDITQPIYNNNDLLRLTNGRFNGNLGCFRPDVFELLAKNNCFVNCDLKHLFARMTDENRPELLPTAERYGLLADEEILGAMFDYAIENHKPEFIRNAEQYGFYEDAKTVGALINHTAKRKMVEWTAYFLELKKRKFGFSGFGESDDFEL